MNLTPLDIPTRTNIAPALPELPAGNAEFVTVLAEIAEKTARPPVSPDPESDQIGTGPHSDAPLWSAPMHPPLAIIGSVPVAQTGDRLADAEFAPGPPSRTAAAEPSAPRAQPRPVPGHAIDPPPPFPAPITQPLPDAAPIGPRADVPPSQDVTNGGGAPRRSASTALSPVPHPAAGLRPEPQETDPQTSALPVDALPSAGRNPVKSVSITAENAQDAAPSQRPDPPSAPLRSPSSTDQRLSSSPAPQPLPPLAQDPSDPPNPDHPARHAASAQFPPRDLSQQDLPPARTAVAPPPSPGILERLAAPQPPSYPRPDGPIPPDDPIPSGNAAFPKGQPIENVPNMAQSSWSDRYLPPRQDDLSVMAQGMEPLPPTIQPEATEGPASQPSPRPDRPTSVPVAQLPAQIVHLLQASPDGPVRLMLRPDDLGALRFELTRTAEGLHIHLAVDQPATLDLLRRHSDQILAEMRASGFAGTSLSYSGGGQDTSPRGGSSPPQAAAYIPPDPSPTPTHPVRGSASCGLDLRL